MWRLPMPSETVKTGRGFSSRVVVWTHILQILCAAVSMSICIWSVNVDRADGWADYYDLWGFLIYLLSAAYFCGMTLVLLALSITMLYSLPNSHWKIHLTFSVVTAAVSSTATLLLAVPITYGYIAWVPVLLCTILTFIPLTRAFMVRRSAKDDCPSGVSALGKLDVVHKESVELEDAWKASTGARDFPTVSMRNSIDLEGDSMHNSASRNVHQISTSNAPRSTHSTVSSRAISSVLTAAAWSRVSASATLAHGDDYDSETQSLPSYTEQRSKDTDDKTQP